MWTRVASFGCEISNRESKYAIIKMLRKRQNAKTPCATGVYLLRLADTQLGRHFTLRNYIIYTSQQRDALQRAPGFIATLKKGLPNTKYICFST